MVALVNRVISQSIGLLALLVASCTWAQSSLPISPTLENWKQSTPNISEVDKTGLKDVVRQERSTAFDD